MFLKDVSAYTYRNRIPLDGAWAGEEWKLYCVYTAWIGIELVVVYFLYVETKGPTLEEIARIFDGDQAEVGFAEVKGIPELSNDRFDNAKRQESLVDHKESVPKY